MGATGHEGTWIKGHKLYLFDSKVGSCKHCGGAAQFKAGTDIQKVLSVQVTSLTILCELISACLVLICGQLSMYSAAVCSGKTIIYWLH